MMFFVLYAGDFRRLVDVNFICAMGPPGGGRNPTSARLLRHFNFLSFVDMEEISLQNIFGCILRSWISKFCFMSKLKTAVTPLLHNKVFSSTWIRAVKRILCTRNRRIALFI